MIKNRHHHVLGLVALLLLIVAATITSGLQYRASLFERELRKYGGHYLTERVIEPVEMQYGDVIPPIDLDSYIEPSDELLTAGQTVYEDYCLSCHGPTGLGDGEMAAELASPPRSFVETGAWINGRKVSDIYRTLWWGVDGSEDMLAYDFLSAEELFAVIHYVRSFLIDPPNDTAEDVSSLDQEFRLSEGILQPNIIPLDLAKQKILDEGRGMVMQAERLAARIRNLQGPDARLARQYVKDEGVLAAVLTRSQDWDLDAVTFGRFIADDPPGKGFYPAVATLEHSAMERLFAAIVTANNVSNSRVGQ